MKRKTKKLIALIVVVSVALLWVMPVASQTGELVPSITVHSRTQAETPTGFEVTRLLVENMKQLGIDAEHRAIPWAQVIPEVWYTREGGRMPGRSPTGEWWGVRNVSDPDEFAYNLFHSSMAEAGYNFVGYSNPEYDALAEAQRAELDLESRQDMLFQLQALIARDLPNIYYAHTSTPQLVRGDIWDIDSVVTQAGIGIHNFWNFTGITPIGDQTDLITSTTSFLEAFNPIFLSGDAPSRVTELVWDRVMRIGPDGLPQPWAAESVEWESNTSVVITLRAGHEVA